MASNAGGSDTDKGESVENEPQDQAPQVQGGTEMPKTTKVFVGSLPVNAEISHVRKLFEPYGPLVECNVVNRCAFVHVTSKDLATKAIHDLHGSNFMGSKIVVEMGRPSTKSKGDWYQMKHFGYGYGHSNRTRPHNFYKYGREQYRSMGANRKFANTSRGFMQNRNRPTPFINDVNNMQSHPQIPSLLQNANNNILFNAMDANRYTVTQQQPNGRNNVGAMNGGPAPQGSRNQQQAVDEFDGRLRLRPQNLNEQPGQFYPMSQLPNRGYQPEGPKPLLMTSTEGQRNQQKPMLPVKGYTTVGSTNNQPLQGTSFMLQQQQRNLEMEATNVAGRINHNFSNNRANANLFGITNNGNASGGFNSNVHYAQQQPFRQELPMLMAGNTSAGELNGPRQTNAYAPALPAPQYDSNRNSFNQNQNVNRGRAGFINNRSNRARQRFGQPLTGNRMLANGRTLRGGPSNGLVSNAQQYPASRGRGLANGISRPVQLQFTRR